MTAHSLLDELEGVNAMIDRGTRGSYSYPPEELAAESAKFFILHHAEIADMAKRLEVVERDAEAYRQLIAGVDAEQLVAASEKHGDALGVLKDAARYRWLRANACDGFMRADGRSLNCDEPESEWDTWIDASINNSAREAVE